MSSYFFDNLRARLLLCGLLVALGCSGSSKNGTAGSGAAGDTAGSGGKSGTDRSGGSGAVSGSGGSGAGASGGGRNGSGNGRAGAGGRTSGGSGGAGTSGETGGSGGATGTDTGASVLERNNHPSRDGHFIQPALTKANAMKMARDDDFKATFQGDMWASPLYLENGPNGKGVFFAVTTGNDVIALDETTGAQVWKHNLGSSPTANGVNCGSIHPLGIVSTPVIDPASRTIYVAGAIGTNKIDRHELHALSVDDGQERAGWPVDMSKFTSNSFKFTPPPQNQRSALSLVNGIVYVAYGGHVGDCGPYHGWVIGIDAKDPSKGGGWATLGEREGIWATGGLASDGTDIFAVTGNGNATTNDRSNTDSEQVVRITGLGAFDRTSKNLYFPTSWRNMDSTDADFGATNPVFVTIPGATPSNYVVAISKDGHVYMLDSANLGGMAGHKVDFSVANGAMALSSVPTVYTTSSGVHLAFSITSGANKCPNNMNAAVMSLKLPAGSPPAPSVAWCAASSGAVGPITTTTDGMNEAIVWYTQQGKLIGVDGETGAVLFNGGSGACSGVRKWASPIAAKGRIIVAADDGLCSWSPH